MHSSTLAFAFAAVASAQRRCVFNAGFRYKPETRNLELTLVSQGPTYDDVYRA